MSRDESPGDLNLDLIQMVQAARMLHDAAARPSDLAAVYWIEAKPADSERQAPTADAGEWRIRLSAETVDVVWERVKALTLAGKLGPRSKVSTRPAAGQSEPGERLLCVRTRDSNDPEDLQRVKSALLELGLTGLEYVADKP